MKTRILLVAAVMLMMASLSFGQGFSAWLYDDSFPLAATCGGADYYADGTALIKIYWDANNNGPDAADVQPAVGDQAGMVNFNEFLINGEAQGLGAGYFGTEANFTSVGLVPPNPFYYLSIHCADGATHYYSPTFSLAACAPCDIAFTNFTCVPCAGGGCVHTDGLIVTDAGSGQYIGLTGCFDLCVGETSLMKICRPAGGTFDPTKPPVGTWGAECQTPGAGVPGPWYLGADGCWTADVVGVVEGCFCFTLDHFLAAGVENFTGVAGDNEATFTWMTASEVNMSAFAVVRNGEVIGSVPATNPNGANYTYTDKTAVNNTTYTYGLRIVHNDNSSEDAGFAVTLTPSFNKAIVTEYALHQNFPNPFNPTTSIAFDVLNDNFVTLKVFNAAGQQVATVVNGDVKAGRHIVSFDAANLTSGLYFYTVKIGNEFSATKKMLLVK